MAPNVLPDYDVLRAEGPDAAAFLQAQLANDVRSIGPSGWQWNCYLTPQGRVQSVFPLFLAGSDVFLLAIPGGLAQAVRERLARYRLRSRLELAVDPGYVVGGSFGDDAPDAVADAYSAELPGSRRLVVAPGARAPEDAEALARWRVADVETGIPVLTAAVSDAHTPQALSLSRLGAYSVKKGCYPGQEIVARTHFLGRSKRALVRFESDDDGPPAPGVELVSCSGNEPVGTVISAAAKAGRGFALLAVVRENHASVRVAGASEAPLRVLEFTA